MSCVRGELLSVSPVMAVAARATLRSGTDLRLARQPPTSRVTPRVLSSLGPFQPRNLPVGGAAHGQKRLGLLPSHVVRPLSPLFPFLGVSVSSLLPIPPVPRRPPLKAITLPTQH